MTRQDHLLVILAEECAEVIQAVSKALRFGLQDGYPDTERTNSTDITRELAHILAMHQLLADDNSIGYINVQAILDKQTKVEEYLKYSEKQDRLNP